MKKIVFSLFLMMCSSLIYAQSVDDISDFIQNPGYDLLKAKAMIDKFQANPKNATKAEGWYLKGKIYDEISKKDSLKSACADCRMEAFDALKKYQEMDSKSLRLVLEQYFTFFDIYNGYYGASVNDYNKADYKGAFTNFKNAGIVEDYVSSRNLEASNGYKFPVFDTLLIKYTGLAAELAKDSADAAIYYKKLTDANLSDPQFLGPYEFLVVYNLNAGNTAAYKEALEKGKKIFPNEPYWTNVELYELQSISSKPEMFKKYDELQQKDPANYTIAYNYAVELYNYIYANDDKTAPVGSYKQPLAEVLKKVIAIKPTGEANLLMARALYNGSFDYGDSARNTKGGKPEDAKRRKALNDMAAAQLDECLPYALAAESYYASLPAPVNPADKANYRATLNILQNVYSVKKDQAKTDEYDKKIKAL